MTSSGQVPIGEICTVNPRARRHGCSDDTAVTFVPMAAVDPRTGTIAVREERRLAEVANGFTAFEEGDVLFAKITPCMQNGKAALARNLANGIGRGSTEFYVLRPGHRVLGEYVWHFVRQPRFREAAKRSFTGTAGQQRVPRSFVENALIPLPPLDEQRRIVDILNRAARIEALRVRAAELLREFVPALFVKMFGDPVENPMGWRTEPLGGVILNGPQNGLYRPKSAYGSGTPILRIDGFYEGRVTDPACWQRVRLDRATVKKFALRKDDIVINRVNSRPFLGKSAIIPDIEEPTVFESNMMRIGLDPSQILPEFLISMLQIGSIKNQLCVNAKEAINQSSINQTDVLQLLVVAPPLALQCRYAEIVEVARAVARVRESSARTAAALMASLMSELLGSDVSDRGTCGPSLLGRERDVGNRTNAGTRPDITCYRKY